MRPFAALALAAPLLACGSSSSGGSMPTCPTGAKAVNVGPGTYGGAKVFSPANLTIAVNDTVCWAWSNGGHSVTSGTGGVADGRFCSPGDANCGAGATSVAGTIYTHQFTAPGSYPYFCAAHWSMGMTGTITVQ